MATILIVDDLSVNRKLLVRLLQPQGHRLIEAADGSEALRAARVEQPDLIITDVLMPVMDGYELVKELRLGPATCSIPVVFATAHYGERDARALAQASGVASVLTKPLATDQVLRVVDSLLTRAPGGPAEAGVAVEAFDRAHVRLLTDKLSENA